MPREDSLSSRFDYLFEPLDDGEPVDDAIDAGSPPVDSTDDDKVAPMPAPVRMAFAAFILGTLGVVAVIAVLLLQRPNEPTQPVNVPLGPVPVSATMSNVPSQAAPRAPFPNQEPRGDGGGGGLLGVGGLL